MDYKELANILFPHVKKTKEELESIYKVRELPQGAVVTRMAPSPTGFVHLGNLVQGLTAERLAHQSGGVLFLRIEDTDLKREVEGAVEVLVDSLKHYAINFDEGATADVDNGDYGPYRQRERKEIYAVYAKQLVEMGFAYPCFCTEEELNNTREKQGEIKANFGYYGEWAIWRDRSIQDIKEMLERNVPWVLRFRSQGNINNKIKFEDLIKGKLELTENDIDHVLLKSDGIPTYHFAHAVDDHLMRTTHVVRGDEWLPSLPFHVQLFVTLGFKVPKYLHIGPLMKMDGTSKRKLSKRKDPELALTYYKQEGFPVESVYEYVLTILNSNYEDWRRANSDADTNEFKFSHKNMNPAGSLFDYMKLRDISKTVISKMNAEKVYKLAVEWADEYDQELSCALKSNEEYAVSIFNIGRGGKKPRKDIATWSEVKEYIGFFYDEFFGIVDSLGDKFEAKTIADVLKMFESTFDINDSQEVWFEKIKEVANKAGFASNAKEYKQEPDKYLGDISDVTNFIRVAITGKCASPDTYQVLQTLSADKVIQRIDDYTKKILS